MYDIGDVWTHRFFDRGGRAPTFPGLSFPSPKKSAEFYVGPENSIFLG